MDQPATDITTLIGKTRGGDKDAERELFERVYPELQRIARQRLNAESLARESTESMIHECYLRWTRHAPEWVEGRDHFFGLVARVMRQVLVDHARARSALRRDHKLEVSLEREPGQETEPVFLRLDDALKALAATAPLPAQLVEMRFFGGFTAEESAEALGLDVHLVRRQLRFGQSWLRRELDT
ncbi:MAG: ECF-type sigma factor [Acidobacteria bacterium]|nr:ECF-type sigma factor [Acidobacteriota bacterium]